MLPHPANLDLIQPLFRQPVGYRCWFCPHSIGSHLARNAAPFILGCLMLGGLAAGYYWLKSRPLRQRLRFLGGTTAVALIAMCLGSQSIQSIWQNAFRYLPSVKQAKEEKVQGPQPVAYKNVMETVVEAGSRDRRRRCGEW